MNSRLQGTLRGAAGLAAGTVLLWLAGCAAVTKADPPGRKEGAGERRYLVKTATVSVRPLKYELETTGSLQALDVYHVDAEVPGIIEDVAFNEGDQVTPKTVLCRISPRTYALAAQRAKDAWQTAKDAGQKALADVTDTERKVRNDIERAKVKMTEAERDLARVKPAVDSGALSVDQLYAVQDRYDQGNVELKDAQEAATTLVETMRALAQQKKSEAKQAETAWQQAEDDLRKCSVYAPVAGTIDQRQATNGSQATPGSSPPLAQLVAPGLKLKFTLAEKDLAAVGVKTRANFRVLAYPGRDFGASIYYVSALSDPKTRMVTCWASVDPTDAPLKSGLFTTVQIVTEVRGSAVVVPLTAVLPTERGFVTYVVENGMANRRTVELGLQVTDQAVEVLKGLTAGETVVVVGGSALQDKVLVKEAQAAKAEPDKTVP